MKRRPGRMGRRAVPRGAHRAAPLWLPLQPPVEKDTRLIGEGPGLVAPGLHADDRRFLFGPSGLDRRPPQPEGEINWVQLSPNGFSVN